MTMKTLPALERYIEAWGTKPLWWRIRNRIWWVADTIFSVLVGRLTPGEKTVLSVLNVHAGGEDLSDAPRENERWVLLNHKQWGWGQWQWRQSGYDDSWGWYSADGIEVAVDEAFTGGWRPLPFVPESELETPPT